MPENADRTPDFATCGLQPGKFRGADVQAVEYTAPVAVTGVRVAVQNPIRVLEQGDFWSCPVGVFKVVDNRRARRSDFENGAVTTVTC